MKCYIGRKLIQEWAMYRWGVLEEHGYLDDPLFPLAYPEEVDFLEVSHSGLPWTPNICTDLQRLIGSFSNVDECPNCGLVVKDSTVNYSVMSLQDQNNPVSTSVSSGPLSCRRK